MSIRKERNIRCGEGDKHLQRWRCAQVISIAAPSSLQRGKLTRHPQCQGGPRSAGSIHTAQMGTSSHVGYKFNPWISSHGVPQPPQHAYTSKQHWVLRRGGWPSIKSAPLHWLQWQGNSKDISRRHVSIQKQSLKIFQHKVRLLSLPLFNSVCDTLWIFFFFSLLNGCQ